MILLYPAIIVELWFIFHILAYYGGEHMLAYCGGEYIVNTIHTPHTGLLWWWTYGSYCMCMPCYDGEYMHGIYCAYWACYQGLVGPRAEMVQGWHRLLRPNDLICVASNNIPPPPSPPSPPPLPSPPPPLLPLPSVCTVFNSVTITKMTILHSIYSERFWQSGFAF